MSPVTRQKRYEGLFSVYYDKPLKDVLKRNKNLEATIGKMQSAITDYQENVTQIQQTIEDEFVCHYDEKVSPD